MKGSGETVWKKEDESLFKEERNMREIRTERLLLRPLRESDDDELLDESLKHCKTEHKKKFKTRVIGTAAAACLVAVAAAAVAAAFSAF